MCVDSAEVYNLELKDLAFKPINLEEGDNVEKIMAALLNQEAMAMDSGYVDDVR